MARLQRRNLRQPDELRPLGRGKLELVELGDVAIGRVSYEPGWRWSVDLKPTVGTRHARSTISGSSSRGA